MHIRVSDILAGNVGEQRSYKIEGERPDLDDLTLTRPLEGEFRVMRTTDGVMVQGKAETAIALNCHRCLRTFDWPVTVNFDGEFVSRPTAEQWPLAADETIDLAPLIRSELIIAQPIKILCRPDCPGLCQDCGAPQDDGHNHAEAGSEERKTNGSTKEAHHQS